MKDRFKASAQAAASKNKIKLVDRAGSISRAGPCCQDPIGQFFAAMAVGMAREQCPVARHAVGRIGQVKQAERIRVRECSDLELALSVNSRSKVIPSSCRAVFWSSVDTRR